MSKGFLTVLKWGGQEIQTASFLPEPKKRVKNGWLRDDFSSPFGDDLKASFQAIYFPGSSHVVSG